MSRARRFSQLSRFSNFPSSIFPQSPASLRTFKYLSSHSHSCCSSLSTLQINTFHSQKSRFREGHLRQVLLSFPGHPNNSLRLATSRGLGCTPRIPAISTKPHVLSPTPAIDKSSYLDRIPYLTQASIMSGQSFADALNSAGYNVSDHSSFSQTLALVSSILGLVMIFSTILRYVSVAIFMERKFNASDCEPLSIFSITLDDSR